MMVSGPEGKPGTERFVSDGLRTFSLRYSQGFEIRRWNPCAVVSTLETHGTY